MAGLVWYAFLMAASPIVSLLGRVAYSLENRKRDDFFFTGNLLLIVVKPPQRVG